MPRRRSQALIDFASSIGIADTLVRREKRYPDPPSPKNIRIVQGLRGGAAVLMVAAFENYLKEVVEERLYDLTLHPLHFKPSKLPEEMVFHNLKRTLERSVEGPFPGNSTKADKILGFQQASQIVVQGIINSQVFSDVARSNPNSKKVKELFKCMGISDIFSTIKIKFDNQWGQPTSQTFISTTLDSILERRHQVAHTAKVLNVSRLDLQESLRFIRILANLCDEELYRHVRKIMK